MVVCAQHVNVEVVATVEFISYVGDIAGDICSIAIRLDDHAVFGVTVIGGLEPPRTFSFIHLTRRLQLLQSLVDGARFKERVFVEVDVEVHAEIVQVFLNLREHHLHAKGAEVFLNFFCCTIERVWLLFHDSCSNVMDVLASVAIFWRRLALGCSHQRTREAVNLSAVIVEVVLAGNSRTGRFKNASQ